MFGAMLAKSLSKRHAYSVSLIDEKERFELMPAIFASVWETELGKIKDLVAEYTRPYQHIFQNPNARFIKGKVLRVTKERVITDSVTLMYDVVVLCSGYSWPPASVTEDLQGRFDLRSDMQGLESASTIIVTGGGISAARIAGNLAAKFPGKSITLVKKQNHVIPHLSKENDRLVKKRLQELKVDVVLRREGLIDPGVEALPIPQFKLSDGALLPFDKIFWCYPKPNTAYLNLKGCLNSDGYIRVNPCFQVIDILGNPLANMFAGGDIIYMIAPEKNDSFSPRDEFDGLSSGAPGPSHYTTHLGLSSLMDQIEVLEKNIRNQLAGRALAPLDLEKRPTSRRGSTPAQSTSIQRDFSESNGQDGVNALESAKNNERALADRIISVDPDFTLTIKRSGETILERGDDARKRLRSEWDAILKRIDEADAPPSPARVKRAAKSQVLGSSKAELVCQINPKTIVIGLSVNGRFFAQYLADRGIPFRLAINNPTAKKQFAHYESKQIEIVMFDFEDELSLNRIFKGMEYCHFVSDNGYQSLSESFPLLFNAIKQANLKHIVYGCTGSSFVERIIDVGDAHLKEWATMIFDAEKQIKGCGSLFTITRFNSTLDLSSFWFGESIRRDKLLRMPNVPMTWIASSDLAACWLEILTNSSSYENKVLTLTGPKAFTPTEFASEISASLGEVVAYKALSNGEFHDWALNTFQHTEKFASVLVAWFASFPKTQEVTSDARTILSREPKSLNEWARSHAHFFVPLT